MLPWNRNKDPAVKERKAQAENLLKTIKHCDDFTIGRCYLFHQQLCEFEKSFTERNKIFKKIQGWKSFLSDAIVEQEKKAEEIWRNSERSARDDRMERNRTNRSYVTERGYLKNQPVPLARTRQSQSPYTNDLNSKIPIKQNFGLYSSVPKYYGESESGKETNFYEQKPIFRGTASYIPQTHKYKISENFAGNVGVGYNYGRGVEPKRNKMYTGKSRLTETKEHPLTNNFVNESETLRKYPSRSSPQEVSTSPYQFQPQKSVLPTPTPIFTDPEEDQPWSYLGELGERDSANSSSNFYWTSTANERTPAVTQQKYKAIPHESSHGKPKESGSMQFTTETSSFYPNTRRAQTQLSFLDNDVEDSQERNESVYSFFKNASTIGGQSSRQVVPTRSDFSWYWEGLNPQQSSIQYHQGYGNRVAHSEYPNTRAAEEYRNSRETRHSRDHFRLPQEEQDVQQRQHHQEYRGNSFDQKKYHVAATEEPVEETKTQKEEDTEILDLHQFMCDDLTVSNPDVSPNSVEFIELVRKKASTFESKVMQFSGTNYSVDYFVLEENLMRLIESLDKIDCRTDKYMLTEKVKVINYIKEYLLKELDKRVVVD